jgi:hypothetical protein
VLDSSPLRGSSLSSLSDQLVNDEQTSSPSRQSECSEKSLDDSLSSMYNFNLSLDNFNNDDPCLDDVNQELLTSFDFCSEPEEHLEPLTSREIAILLVELRCRHSLTKSCVTHFCELLQVLRVPNAPISFDSIESLVLSSYRSTTFPTAATICPSCFKQSNDLKRCTSTINCPSKVAFVRSPTVNYTFALEPQIRSILSRNQIVYQSVDTNLITDITEGRIYRKLLKQEKEPFITLLLNSDGGVVKFVSTSVWVTVLVINELPRSARFLPENTILAMISTGSMKPKKNEIATIISNLIDELRRLEQGIDVTLHNGSQSDSEQRVKVFLFACVCDKPATSLIMNHNESTGYFGCTKCTIKGRTGHLFFLSCVCVW